MPHDLSLLTAKLLSEAKKAGAEGADAIAVSGQSLSIDIRKGALEQAERAEGTEVGLRVLLGHRQACVSASDVSDATLARLAERAVAMAREAPEDPTVGLADPAQLARGWDAAALDMCDPAEAPTAATLEAAARRAEAAALAAGDITQVEASGAWSRREMHLAASNGFAGGYARTSHSLSAVAFTGTGTAMERDWAAEGRTYAADMPQAEEIGARAGERALSRAGAVKPPTGAFPVVFDERVASSMVMHVLVAVNGSMIARGTSWLRDKLGQQILPRGLSIIEDPHRPRISGSRPFDGEGLPTARRAIVQDGVLMGWTLDLATGRKLGLPSTGNAARGTGSPPSPSTSNVDLTQGHLSREDLLAQMGTGLLVTSLMGSTINPTTGDYSRGASGFWVEGGQIRYPVNECTIAGNLLEMLMRMTPGNDAKAHHSTRVPSLLIEGLMLAGGRDLALLVEAAEDAGRIALGYWRKSPKVWEKPDDQGPVSEADLAVNAALEARLRAARPDYGWLSEESPDNPARLRTAAQFILDPIDGTRNFLHGDSAFAVSVAVVRQGQPVAGVVHLPALGKTYAATADGPALLNGAAIRLRPPTAPPEVLTGKATLAPEHWPGGVPQVTRVFRGSMAWRLCLVAEGAHDATLTLRPSWEWDIAAGALIAARAGAAVSDRHGAALRFNAAVPLAPGVVAAAPGLHADFIARLNARA